MLRDISSVRLLTIKARPVAGVRTGRRVVRVEAEQAGIIAVVPVPADVQDIENEPASGRTGGISLYRSRRIG